MRGTDDTSPTSEPIALSRDEIVARLRRMELFRGVSEEGLNVFASLVDILHVGPGERLCHQGDPGESMWCILSGSVRITADGAAIADLTEGSVVGEMSILDGSPRSADVDTTADTIIAQLTHAHYAEAFTLSADAALTLVRNISKVQQNRLRTTNERAIATALEAERAERLERRYRRFFLTGLFAVGGVLLALLVTAEVTSQPSFCGSHHYLRPYYESWQRSSHSEVGCPECHFAPGFKGYVVRKYKALAEVAIYITNTYKGEPRAEVGDEGCLRSGCHSDARPPGDIEYKGLLFSHRKHLPCGQHHLTMNRGALSAMPSNMTTRTGTPPEGHEKFLEALPRGRILRCVSCHSQIVQGSHMEVTQSTCFLCHFKAAADSEPVSGCPSCHQAPKETIYINNIAFKHEEFTSRGVTCTQCHTDVVRGDGAVKEERCFQCHDRPERLREFENHKLIHGVHVTEHKLDCLICHSEIEHKIESIATTIRSDCQQCHESVERMYMGVADGVEVTPDPMFLARVACDSCHSSHVGVEMTSSTRLLKPGACASCHGDAYEGMQERWLEGGRRLIAEMEARESRVRGTVSAAASSRSEVDPAVRSARSLLAAASTNVDLLRKGNPVHNVRFAERVASVANAQLTMATNVLNGRSAPVAPLQLAALSAPEGGRCGTCHFGIESVSKQVYGTLFSHAPHITKAGLKCAQCHSSEPQELPGHGKTLVSADDCKSCHHSPTTKSGCLSCHSGIRSIRVASKPTFDHDRHVSGQRLACSQCHASDTSKRFTGDCVSCHHRQTVDVAKKCTTCHATQSAFAAGTNLPSGSAGLHVKAQVACGECHRRAGERIVTMACGTCHTTGNYDAIRKTWQDKTRAQLAELARERTRFQAAGGARSVTSATLQAMRAADAAASRIAADGSSGVHNPEYVDTILSQGIEAYRRANPSAAR
ncbi:cyclic nucleotide-binding domain-containing protein [Candidatus Poribacteria bacterium]|nr:cyclic nucleotide-binding domain-containing protein [Candidatus Poribacteria bacterium]